MTTFSDQSVGHLQYMHNEYSGRLRRNHVNYGLKLVVFERRLLSRGWTYALYILI